MDWYDLQPDGLRYELLNGRIYEMQAERASHARAKGALYIALVNAIKARNVPCEAFIDSMAVRVDDKTVFEPDVLVQCGPPVPGSTVMMREPVIVVEVLSPSSVGRDLDVKPGEYLPLPTVQAYIVASQTEAACLAWVRGADGAFPTEPVEFAGDDVIAVARLGVALSVAEIYRGIPLTNEDSPPHG